MSQHRSKIIIAAVIVLALISLALYQSGRLSFLSAQSSPVSATSAAGSLSVTFFDVGQGDSSLIVTPQKYQILVDGGPDNTIAAKLGAALPFYDHDLDLVILSHPHADHVAGLVEILKRYRIKKIIMTGAFHTAPDYLEFLKLIKDKNIPVQVIDKPQDFSPEAGIDLSFLWPRESLAEKKLDNLNNSSIVFKMIYASTSYLFMGDLEEEEQLASATPAVLKSDVLKVGHHGSINANSAPFLKLVSPQYAIISVGAANSYGLPGYRTIHELTQLGTRIFRTDQDGDIKCLSDGNKVSCTK